MKTILVMDEDAAVRESLRSVLQAHHYQVVLAADGLKALDTCDCDGIDLLLLDATFPLRHGWDAYKRFAFRIPPLPIILLDGHAGRMRTPVPAGVRIFLNKPFDAPSLLRIIRALLKQTDAMDEESAGDETVKRGMDKDTRSAIACQRTTGGPDQPALPLQSMPNPST